MILLNAGTNGTIPHVTVSYLCCLKNLNGERVLAASVDPDTGIFAFKNEN